MLAAICLLALPAALADEHDSPEIRYLTCVALVESAPEAALKRALELKGDLAGAHYDLMTVYMSMGRPDLASTHKRLFEQYRHGQGD